MVRDSYFFVQLARFRGGATARTQRKHSNGSTKRALPRGDSVPYSDRAVSLPCNESIDGDRSRNAETRCK